MTRATQRAMPPRANMFGVMAMYPAAAIRAGYPIVVGPVADGIVDHHHPRPRPLPAGNAEQRVDRTVRGVDRDGLHADQSTGQDRLAAISSKAAIVGNSLVASCGSGQLDSLAATMSAARLT